MNGFWSISLLDVVDLSIALSLIVITVRNGLATKANAQVLETIAQSGILERVGRERVIEDAVERLTADVKKLSEVVANHGLQLAEQRQRHDSLEAIFKSELLIAVSDLKLYMDNTMREPLIRLNILGNRLRRIEEHVGVTGTEE